MTWLIVGGAGYIGSHIVHQLYDAGLPVVVLDNLSSGDARALPGGVHLEVADACDTSAVETVMRKYSVSGVVHLAAYKHARESVANPLQYWRNNLGALLGVLEAATSSPVQWFLLSSSCSVYGSAGEVRTDTPLNPESPYASTKAASESLLEDWARTTGVPWAVLRYFNVVGNADFPFAPDRSTECLIPAITKRIQAGKRPLVFGADFDTPDGSALRDYVDVRDLARAHAVVAQDLSRNANGLSRGKALNVSTGSPTSVLTIAQLVSELMNWSEPPEILNRRTGDPDKVWTTPSPELASLGWAPSFSLRESIRSHVTHRDSGCAAHPPDSGRFADKRGL